MILFTALCALASLFGWSWLLHRRAGVPASAAPLTAFSAILLALLCAGMAGALRAAGWALLAGGWVLLGGMLRACRTNEGRESLREMRSPGSALFFGGGAALALRLAWLGAEFTSFDEYSFWGTAAKLTVLNGKLYTECKTGVPWQVTQYAALPLAGWWAQPLGAFAAWAAIWGVDLVLLAGLAAVLAPAEKAGARVWGPLGLAALLAPTLFSLTSHTSQLSTAWLEVLGDVPAGVLFGAAAACWLVLREKGPAARWLILPVLCLAANIKQNTFVLGLAAAGLAALDGLLLPARKTKGAAPAKKAALAARIGFAAAAPGAVAVQYAAWGAYTAALVRKNQAAGGYGDTSEPLGAVLQNGLRMLLGGTGTAYYEQRRAGLFAYAQTMRAWFWSKPVSLLGSGAAVCTAVAVLFAASALLARTRRERLRAGLWALGSSACFAGYWVLLLLSYAFVLKDSTPENPVSYSRYFLPFYLGWFLLALAFFGRAASLALTGAEAAESAAVPAAAQNVQERPRSARGRETAAAAAWARAAALLLAAAFALLAARGTEPQFTVLGASRGTYDSVRAELDIAQRAAQAAPGKTFFLVAQGDEGYDWFLYSEALLPDLLAYGTGGGTYGLPGKTNAGRYDQAYTPEAFRQLVADSGADYLLIARTDALFAESYGTLFTDGLALAENGPALYTAAADGYAPYAALSGEADA